MPIHSAQFLTSLVSLGWKNIDPDRLAKYSELASEDAERYKKEMKSYNSRQEAKMRSEAVKPPSSGGYSHGSPGRAGSRPEMGPPPPGPHGMDPRVHGPYDMQSAFANPAMAGGYGYGMDYGYGMGASMYGYGGYPPMGGSPEQMYAQGGMYQQQMYGQYPQMGYDQGYQGYQSGEYE